MKKGIISIFLVFAVVAVSVTVSYADIITDSLMEGIKICLSVTTVNADEDEWVAARNNLDSIWRASPSGAVKVSYDALSSAVISLNTNGAPCVMRQMSVNGAVQYFICGTGRVIMSTGGSYDVSNRSFCDRSGAAYYAEAPNTSPSTTPTVPDFTDEIAAIQSNLDFLPIIAEIDLLIAQTLNDTWDWFFMFYDQIDIISSRLYDIYSQVSYSSSLLSSINIRLSNLISSVDSVITTGKLRVDTSSLDAKLDKLLGLYAEVNSAEFDSAAFNSSSGSSISDAVGGELSNLVFWGRDEFMLEWNSRISYVLNGVPFYVDDSDGSYIRLLGVNLGASIPAEISSNPALVDGVWQDSTGKYILSDTYSAKTGVLTRRVVVGEDGFPDPADAPEFEYYAPHSAVVPAGNSTLTPGFQLRITCNYEQLGGVTKTADIITAIQSIPTYDDTNLISAVTTISNQITEQFGQYDAPYAFPNVCHGSASRKYISGVSPAAFTEIPDGSRVFYSTSNTVDSIGSSGTETSTDSSTAWRRASWRITPYYSFDYGFCYLLSGDASMRSTFSSGGYSRSYYIPLSVEVFDLGYRSHVFSISLRVRQYRESYNAFHIGNYYIYPKWDDSGAWVGWYLNDTLLSSSGEPSKRLLTSPPASGNYYIYGTSSDAVPVVYSSRFTGFLQSQADRVVNAIGAIPQPETTDLTTIETTLSTIADKLDNTASDVNNTVINITSDNDKFSVFYITDEDGNTQPVTDFAGDLTGASGKLLSLLYRLVFADALDSVDDDLSNIEDFFTSEEPPQTETAAVGGDSAPTDEVASVWDT